MIILLNLVNELFGSGFNAILINRYKDGEDKIGAHSDDEKYLDTNAGVVSISYQKKEASRKFRIREKKTKKK